MGKERREGRIVQTTQQRSVYIILHRLGGRPRPSRGRGVGRRCEGMVAERGPGGMCGCMCICRYEGGEYVRTRAYRNIQEYIESMGRLGRDRLLGRYGGDVCRGGMDGGYA